MADVSPEVQALARRLAKQMAEPMAEQMARKAVQENFFRVLYTMKNRTTTLSHQIDGISADLDDHCEQLEQQQTMLVAIAMQLNALAAKLGVPSEIQLPRDGGEPEDEG